MFPLSTVCGVALEEIRPSILSGRYTNGIHVSLTSAALTAFREGSQRESGFELSGNQCGPVKQIDNGDSLSRL